MFRRSAHVDLASVSGDVWVNPVIVNVTVENLEPFPRARKSELIWPPGLLAEANHNYDVIANSVEPAMKGKDPIIIVDVVDVDAVAA